eukprot:jgi/Phyca11/107791/e_gw1.14.363.1
MPSQASLPKHSTAEKLRVLDACRAGRTDWLMVAKNNGISRAVAYRIVDAGRVNNLPRGGARLGSTKVTPLVKEQLEEYLNENCTFTMETMRRMLALDLGVAISTSTISLQCAVNSAVGVVLHRLERGSIRMEQNADFIDEIYATAKASQYSRENYAGKTIVVVLDKAPAHRQMEERVTSHADLELLRLAPTRRCATPLRVASPS